MSSNVKSLSFPLQRWSLPLARPKQRSKGKVCVLLEATSTGRVEKGAGVQWEHTQPARSEQGRFPGGSLSPLAYQPLHPDKKRDQRQDQSTRRVLYRASQECGKDEVEMGRMNKGLLIVIICGFLLSTLSLRASSWGH